MTRYHVVTTMNAAGWAQTGRRMVESFIERWPQEAMPLTVYAEGFEPDAHPSVVVRQLPPWLDEFKAAHRINPARNGRRGGTYDYRYDAVKFAHKVAAIADFGAELTDGVMIWLDADTFTHADVTAEWLEGLFPGAAYLAWLDRANTHPENGFIMFRPSHPYHATFMKRFRDIYATGEVFRLQGFDDCSVLKHLVTSKVASGKIPPPVSLSGDTRWHHPFVNGPLGARLDHLKGPRKLEGRSRTEDARVPRSEPYWVK